MPSVLTQLLGYYLQDDTLDWRYNGALREAFKQDDLQGFVETWKTMFQLGLVGKPEIVRQPEEDLVNGTVDWDEVRKCLAIILDGKSCEHLGDKPCHAVCLTLPYALLSARVVAMNFGVPFCMALHQRFCDDPSHEGCF